MRQRPSAPQPQVRQSAPNDQDEEEPPRKRPVGRPPKNDGRKTAREGDELAESAPPTKKVKVDSESVAIEVLGRYDSIRENPNGGTQGNKPHPPKR